MKVVDLTKISKTKLNHEIQQICGGLSIENRWMNGVGKGLGGFSFKDPQSVNDDDVFSCNLAFYTNGLGIYFRNSFANYLVLIPQAEIVSLDIAKKGDKIKPTRFSPYQVLIKMGIDSSVAAGYLMPKEIIEEHPASFKIRLDDTFFLFELRSLSLSKLKKTLAKTKLANLVQYDIAPPLYF